VNTDRWAADLTLAEVNAARLHGRRRIGQLTFPLLALAALLLCSAGWALAVGRHHLAIFYAPGLLVVAAWSGWHARRDARRNGVQVKVWPWIAMAVVLLILSATVSRWSTLNHHTTVEEIGPSVVFALGIVVFGLWGRTPTVVSAGMAMVIVSLASPLLAAGDACVAIQLVAYALLLTAAARWLTPRSASP
jgi:hypothetical protein